MAVVNPTAVQPIAPAYAAWRVMQPLHTDDGVPLHLRHWGGGPQARGTVLLVHGLGEHMGRYDALAADLNRAGWHVAGHDHRGHGASGGARGRIPRDDSLLRDLARVIDLLRETREGPLVLLGHSMGGVVAARYVSQVVADPLDAPSWYRRVDALVLSSPAFELGMSATQRLLLGVLGRFAPDLQMGNGLDAAWVSRNAAVVEAYRRDPLVHDRVTARLVRFMVDASRHVQQRAPVWSMPTLLMWAGADHCVVPEGSVAFAEHAPEDIVRTHGFDSMAHEIFNEPERDQPVSMLTQWLGERFAR